MKRRNFVGAIIGAIGLTGVAVKAEPNCADAKALQDVNSLMQYAEQRIKTITKFADADLMPHQKDVLKAMYKFDKLVIIQGRQIGLSTVAKIFAEWFDMQDGQYSLHFQNQTHMFSGGSRHMCLDPKMQELRVYDNIHPDKLSSKLRGMSCKQIVIGSYDYARCQDLLDSKVLVMSWPAISWDPTPHARYISRTEYQRDFLCQYD